MAGFTPNEGETLVANIIYKRILTDRDVNGLEMGLFTNASVDETTVHSGLTEPTGGGYARITLTDSGWTVTNDTASYAQQTFTATGSAYVGTVKGYFIATIAAGGTKRLLHIEVDASGPYTMNTNDTYKITLNNSIA